MAIPGCAFYYILWKNAVDLPIFDDYANVLEFCGKFVSLHGVFSRLWLTLTFQHNEYKLIFENAVVATEYVLSGHVHFLSLVALGNAFALLIFLTVCCMFRGAQDELATRFLFLVPVAYLVFQLQYASALDWASSSLQHLAVIFFSLLSIHLLSKPLRGFFACACIALVLAIAASANGFFVVPIGILMLAQQKRWGRMPAWLGSAAIMLLLYLWHYNYRSSQTNPHGSVAVSIVHLNAIYALSFIGASAARYQSIVPAVIFGVVLIGIFLLAVRNGYFRKNPSVFYSMLFVLITAVGVSGLRSGFGVAQSLASRYRLYSNLMIVFAYFFLVESWLERMKTKFIRRAILVSTFAFAVVFCCLSTMAGARFLHNKKLLLIQSMKEWQSASHQQSDEEPGIQTDSILARQIDAGVYRPLTVPLRIAIHLGIYQIPSNIASE